MAARKMYSTTAMSQKNLKTERRDDTVPVPAVLLITICKVHSAQVCGRVETAIIAEDAPLFEFILLTSCT